MDNTCVCCGVEIPEGRQVCKACEEGFIAQNQETLIADDVQPKTIPTRSTVRCIGYRPVTKYRKPQIRRAGCRHR